MKKQMKHRASVEYCRVRQQRTRAQKAGESTSTAVVFWSSGILPGMAEQGLPEFFYRQVKVNTLSRVQPLRPRGPYSPQDSPGQNARVGSLSLLQGIFPTQGLNSGLQHCRWIFYQLSPKGSPRILEWVTYPFSSRFSQSGTKPGSPALQVGSLTTDLSGKKETMDY